MFTLQYLKRFLLSALALMAFVVGARAEGEMAYAVWCADNTTLYFLGSVETLTAGGTFTPEGASDPVNITSVWSGTAVTATSTTNTPGWQGTVKNALTTAVFESSFVGFTPTSLRGWFYQCAKLTSVKGISNLNTSATINMAYMFYGCTSTSFTSLDLHSFDTGNVTDMQYMFSNSSYLTSIDVSGWSNTKVTNMYAMFYKCPRLTSLNLTDFGTAAVTNMESMFQECSAMTGFNLSSFNTSSATNMKAMFKSCTSLTGINLSGFTTGNVTTTQEMFNGCTNVESIDLSGWANTKLTNLTNMFRDCKKLSTLTLTGFQTSAATTFNSMFVNCQALESINLSSFNTEKVTDMQYMFYGCSTLQNLDLSGFNTGAVTSMYQMFYNCSALQSVNLSGWVNTKVTNMSQMFQGCTLLNSPNFTNFNTSAVQNMSYMFVNCKALTSLNLSSFNTANVTNMSYMFQNCQLLGSLDLSGFNTAKVTSMQYMFDGCNALASVDVSNFNTSNVTNMSCMFQNCQTLTGLELSSFNTAKVTNMSSMFNGCSNLTDIYVSLAWTTGLVNSSSNMFKGCSSLVGEDGTTLATYNNSSLDRTHATDEAGGYLKTGTTTDLDEPLAYAIWCADNATLYFLQSNKQLVTGRLFTPNGSDTPMRMTTVWSGTQVTATGSNNPSWYNTVKTALQHVVFEPSFANVAPTSICAWFRDCVNLTDINGIANLNTATVTNMSYLFSGTTAIQSLDLSNLNTVNVTNMAYMFQNCSSLTRIDLSGWNTASVTNMSYMLSGCNSLTTLDLSAFNTVKVTNMSNMFNGCMQLQSIYVGSYWSIGQINVNNTANMFLNCTALVGEDGTTYNSATVNRTVAHYGTGGYLRLGTEATAEEEVYAVWCADNTTLYFLKTNKPLFRYGLFRPAGKSEALSITYLWSGTQVTATSTTGTPGWQSTVRSSMTIAVFEPSFAGVLPTSLRGWFYQCTALLSIQGIGNLNTSAVTNMAYLFSGCNNTSFTTLDLHTFDTGNVTDMQNMFNGCTNLNALNLVGFNTEKVTTMANMFQNCSSLTELDLTSFSYSGSGTVSRGNMFNGCTNLRSIYAIDLGATANTGSGIFTGCSSIVGEDGTVYNSSQTGSAMLNYDGGYLRNGRSARVVWCSVSGTLYFTTINRNEMPQAGDTFTPAEGEADTISAIWSAEDVTDIGSTLPGWNSVAASVQQVVIEPAFSYVRANSLYGWFEGFSHITGINGMAHLAKSAATATTMSRMFKDCTALITLDLTTFATANVTDMSQMFSGCSSLASITADAGWTTASVTSSADMFNGCASIVGQDGTTYDGSVVDKTKAHYSTGGYLRGMLRPYVVLCKSVNKGTLYFLAETSAFAEATTYTPSGSDTPQAIDFLWTEEDMGSVDSNPAWVINDNARSYIYHVVVDPSFAIFRPTSLRAWFLRCSNLKDLTGLENLNTSQVTSMFATFELCSGLETIDLSMLDVSNVTDMNSLFQDAYGIKSINVSGWNTSKVTEMNNMFSSITYQDFTLKSLDLSSFDTHNVTDMSYMFDNRSGLKTIYVGEGWNTDKVVGTYPGGWSLFNRCNSLVGQDGTTYNDQHISADYAHYGTGGYLTLKADQWPYAIWCGDAETLYFTYSGDTYVAGGTFTPAGSNTPLTITALWYDKEVTDYIHYGSISGTPEWTSAIINDEEHPLKHIVFEPSFANAAITTTRYWFSSLRDLEDISGIEYLNTANVTDMSNMFQLCLNLESIDLSHLNTANVTNMSGMFDFCSSLQTLDVSGLNTTNVTNMSSMFAACKSLTTLDLSTFNTAKVTDMSYMFDGNSLLTSINLSSFNTGAVTNMAYMFSECPLLSTLDLSHFNTANVTNMRNMFSESTGLTTLNLSSFNTAKVSNMLQMFYGCHNLMTLDLSSFNTSQLSATANMFTGCQNLTTLDISGFNTSNIESMMAMFSGCSSLTSLDLSSFNTSNVANMYAMFKNCSNLKDIFVSDNWTTAALSEMAYTGAGYVNGKAEIFTNCTAIEGEDGTTYTSGNNSSAYAHTGEGGYLKLKPMNNDIADIASTPLTLEVVQAGTITITNANALTLNYTSSVSGAHSSSANPIVIEVAAGETISLECSNTTHGMNFNITSTNDVYVYGNALSLVFGSDFAGQTDLSGCEINGILSFLFCLGPEGKTLNPTIRNHPTKDIALPATTLSDGCYMFMFSGCSNLTRGPELPATTLAEDCYHRMFEYSGLVMAPALPATALSGQVYGGMFDHCANLRYVKCLATDIVDTTHGEDGTTDCWLANVAATGTFVKADAADWSVKTKTGAIINGIPAGWTVLNVSDFDPYATPLTLEAVEAGTINIHNPNTLTIEYCKDGSTWTSSNSNPISIEVAAGDQVCFRGDNPAYGKVDMETGEHYTRFTATNDVYIYGNVMSLISSEGYTTLATLPVVGSDDPYDMDINLAFLFSTPTDDADWAPKDNTTIKNHPTKDIVLPAINVTRSGYMYMFSGCQGLTRAPELPATDLGWGCYHQMFSNCISLTAAPELPATTVPMEGYSWMFNGCSSLNYVKCLATDISADGCTGGWLTDVAPTGIFIKAADMNDWTVGPQGEWNAVNGIPSGWTVESDGEYIVTIPSSGVGTFSADRNVTVPNGVTAYYCSSFDSDASEITLVPVTGNVIPAETGVLLRGTAGETYTLTATTDAEPIVGNMLVAVTTPTHIEPTDGDMTNFILKSGTFVRVAAASESSKMAANKAYLQIPTEALTQSGGQVKLMWPGDVATGVIFNVNDNDNGRIYDLSGRHIPKASIVGRRPSSARGLYIINGRKEVR